MTAPKSMPSSAAMARGDSRVRKKRRSPTATTSVVRLRSTTSVTALTSLSASRLDTSMATKRADSGAHRRAMAHVSRGRVPRVWLKQAAPASRSSTVMRFCTMMSRQA